jgi:hypothetical protein
LRLDFTKVTDKGIDALKALRLEELTLVATDVDDAGAELIAAMPNLKVLDLYHTLVSERGYERIKSSLPHCNIVWEKDSALPSRRLRL